MPRNLESCKMTDSEHNTFHYNTAFDTMQSRIWIPNPLPPIHNLEICTHTNSQQQLIVHLRQYKISEPKHFSSNMWLCEKASGSHSMHFVGYLSPIRTNSLPPSEPRSLPRDLSSTFYKLLKTFIFARAWAWSASE